MKKVKKLMPLFLLPAILAMGASDGQVAVSRSIKLLGGEHFRADYNSLSDTEDAAAELNLELAAEGTVLLKNRNNALPLSTATRPAVTVLGAQADTLATGGSGSGGQNKPAGDNTPDSPHTIFDALEAANIDYNPSVKAAYELPENAPKALSNGNAYDGGHYMEKVGSSGDGIVEFDGSYYASLSSGGTLDGVTLTGYTDAALVVVSRTGAEGNDNLAYDLPNMDDPTDHYLQLDTAEKELVAYAKKNFDKVIMIINSPAAMELGALENDDEIDAVVWIGQTGWNGIMTLGKVLTGEINPSGKTVDIYMRYFESDPTFYNFGDYRQANHIINGSGTGNGVASGRSLNLGYDAAYAVDGVTDAGKAVIDYAEGIYMGYRYYETVYAELVDASGATAADQWYDEAVVYPFGYGLSYTTFTQEITDISTNVISTGNETITVTVNVTNTGSVAGKDVVQLYNRAPYTADEIEKADQVLVGFDKTGLIQPGGSETVTITIDAKDLSSFDYNDANGNSHSGYELEAGSYDLSIKANSHDEIASRTVTVGTTINYEEDEDPNTPNNIFSQESGAWEQYNTTSHHWSTSGTDNYLRRTQLLDGDVVALEDSYTAGSPNYLQEQLSWLLVGNNNLFKKEAHIYVNGQEPDEAYLDYDNRLTVAVEDDYENVWVRTNDDIPSNWTQGASTVSSSGLYETELAEMKGVDFDDPRWDEFMNQLTWTELVRIVQDGGYGSDAISTIGKPDMEDHDGPGQLRQEATTTPDGNGYAWVCESVIGSTWNKDLCYEQGKIVGNEAIFLGVTGWYGPGANIHRNPLAGRNFEYYSQDPIHSGYILASVVRGFQEKGGHTYMKHSFLNDQETSRSGIVTFATEQAIREIYAKPFEIAVRDAGANGMMTSFNRIGLQSSVSYAINQQMYINEWGYKGMTVTDAYYSGCGWDSEAMVRGSVVPLNSVFAIFPPATAIEGTYDASLRSGKGGVMISDGKGGTIESPTQYYYARTTAKRAMYTYANSNAFTGLTAKNVLSSKTFYFNAGRTLSSYSAYRTADLEAFHTNMASVFGGADKYDVTVTGLPAGLSLDLTTGQLTGTVPAKPGYYTYDIVVTGKDNLSYISRTTTSFINVTAPIKSNEPANIDFKMPVEMVEGDNYIPTPVDERVTSNSALQEKYVEVSYSAEGLPAGLTMDPATGTVTGTLTETLTPGQRIPVTITQSAVYGEPWGFMPGFMFTTKTYTTTVYLEYQTDDTSIVDITSEEVTGGVVVTIRLANGDEYTFFVPSGADGQDGATGPQGPAGQDGAPGQDGTNGTNGADGADGVGIESVETDENGNLVITYTDGTTDTIEVAGTSTSSNAVGVVGTVIGSVGLVAAAAALVLLFLKKK